MLEAIKRPLKRRKGLEICGEESEVFKELAISSYTAKHKWKQVSSLLVNPARSVV